MRALLLLIFFSPLIHGECLEDSFSFKVEHHSDARVSHDAVEYAAAAATGFADVSFGGTQIEIRHEGSTSWVFLGFRDDYNQPPKKLRSNHKHHVRLNSALKRMVSEGTFAHFLDCSTTTPL